MGRTSVKYWYVCLLSIGELKGDPVGFVCVGQTSPTHQLSVENLPDVKGYATGDVFIKHPTIEGFWKMYVVERARTWNNHAHAYRSSLTVLAGWMTS